MPISIEADPTLAQGYLKVNGVTAATVTSTGLTTASLQNAAVTPTKLSQPFTFATAKAFNWNGSTINTSIDCESIPSWAKRITVIFNGVSTSGTSLVQVQIGAGSFLTSGYVSAASTNGANATSTAGFIAGANASAGDNRSGCVVVTNINSNTWVASGSIGNNTNCSTICGTAALSGTLDRVRITTVNGTDTFDAGTVNISYE